MDFDTFWPGWPGGASSTLALVDAQTDVDSLFRMLFSSASAFQVRTCGTLAGLGRKLALHPYLSIFFVPIGCVCRARTDGCM